MPKIKVLFASANPSDLGGLGLDREHREIQKKIRMAEFRDEIEIIPVPAARPKDLLHALNQHRPDIVHFSGHGSDSSELMMVDRDGLSKPIPEQTISHLFQTLKDRIKVVVLNACHSHTQARAVSQHIDCTIGMNDEIGDEAAIEFAAAFYGAIGFGKTIQEAFDQGKLGLMLEGIPEDHIPILIEKSGVKASGIRLVDPQ